MSGEASLRYLYCSPWPFFCPKCAWDIHGEKTNSMFWTVEDKCFWYCREGVVFFCNDPITTRSQTMHLAGKYNESFSVLTLKLVEYVLTCLVGVEDCKTECSWSESDLLNSGLSRSLPTFIGEQSAASTCRIFVMSSIFRFSILDSLNVCKPSISVPEKLFIESKGSNWVS